VEISLSMNFTIELLFYVGGTQHSRHLGGLSMSSLSSPRQNHGKNKTRRLFEFGDRLQLLWSNDERRLRVYKVNQSLNDDYHNIYVSGTILTLVTQNT